MSTILITTLFYKALLLQGEIWPWSLLGLKGLINSGVISLPPIIDSLLKLLWDGA